MVRYIVAGVITAMAIAVGLVLPGGTDQRALAVDGCSYSGKITIFPYGIATIEMNDCGSDLDGNVAWHGKKDVLVEVTEPDGTVQTFLPQSNEVEISIADADTGAWTFLVKNGRPSRLKVEVEINFE